MSSNNNRCPKCGSTQTYDVQHQVYYRGVSKWESDRRNYGGSKCQKCGHKWRKSSLCTKYEFCGYSNCFKPFYKMRGFMPCCEYHYKNPKKWGKDGQTYTGSVFIKKEDS